MGAGGGLDAVLKMNAVHVRFGNVTMNVTTCECLNIGAEKENLESDDAGDLVGVVDAVTWGGLEERHFREVMTGHEPTYLSAGTLPCNLDDISSSAGLLGGYLAPSWSPSSHLPLK